MTNPPTTQTQDLAGGPVAPLPPPIAGAVTILTAHSAERRMPKRATKVHRRNGSGGWETQGYDKLKMFSGRVERADTLFDFMAVLTNASRNPGSIVVAEAIRGEADVTHMRRLTKIEDAKKKDPAAEVAAATLCPHPEGVRWICWEVDHIAALPDWFDPTDLRARDRDTDLAEWWIKTHLPECFHNRSAILQWSASALVGNKVSMHLWQWLDRPVARASVKAYASAHWKGRMDVTVWDAGRVHYIAAPIFEAIDGSKIEDALGPWRWQWVKGAAGDACEAPPEWVDQPTWEQQLADAKAESARLRAEFMAARSSAASSRSGSGGGEASGDETGAITSADLLPLRDLDPKRVLAWASKIGTRCADQIRSAAKGGADGRHPTARSYSLFFGNVLEGLDRMGAALSEEARKRVNWHSEVMAVEGAVMEMESAAIAAGDGDPDRARVVRWAIEMGRLGDALLPDYRLKEKYRESANGAKVIQMKRKGGGLPAYEEQPAVPPQDEDGGDIETNEDGEPIEDAESEATEPGKPKPFRLIYERKLDTCTKGPDYRVWTEDEWEKWAEAWNKRPPFWCQTWREHVDSLGWWRLPSETELADRACLALSNGADAPGPVADEGALWSFSTEDGIWVEVDEDAFHRVVMRWDGQLADDPTPSKSGPKELFVSIGKRACDNAYAQALRMCACAGFFAEAPHGFAVRDSFMRVDFTKKEIVEEPLSHTHRARFRMDVDLANTPPSPLLDKYKETVHAGAFDWKERLQVMAELGFVALTGTGPQFERGAMLNGEGGSGKSQFLNMVEELIPKRARCAIPPHELGGDYEKASLAGKTLNIYADAESSDIIREGAIKMIMHGETIKARNPYGRVFDLKPRALHLFSCNDWPAAPGVSNAFWDRWIAIRFERRFRDTEAVIKDIGRTIAKTETAALVKWFLDAGRELLKAGRYTVPSSTISLMGEWRAEGDSVAAWRVAATEPCTEADPKHWMSATAAYADYKMWCDTNGFRGVVNSTNFGKRLKTAGVEHIRKTAGIFYRLLKVTPPEDEDEARCPL